MSQSQTAINAAATRWLGDVLDGHHVPDPYGLAERVTRELISRGLAPVPKPFPIKATGPSSTPEGRAAARAEFERIRAERSTRPSADQAHPEGERA